jgi:hypothetical protein
MNALALLATCVGLAFCAPSHAAGLPDTGQDTCYTDSAVDTVSAGSATSVDRDSASHPRQDCRYGRDPAVNAGALSRIGGGVKGFDYSKIANNGGNLGAAPAAALGTAPGDWACTLDNVTGLIWEVKTAGAASAELRSMNSTYSWYSSNVATNGGNAGTAAAAGGNCQTTNACDTEKFVAAVNAIALCGHSDWRLPTRRELQTLLYAGVSSPAIDGTYFPNTPSSLFWSGSTYAQTPVNAWGEALSKGSTGYSGKSGAHTVRLVSGAPL